MYCCLFIINPSSGQNSFQEKLDSLIGKLVIGQLVNHVDTFFTKKHLDAFDKAMEVDDNQYDFIVVVGGDGTINEVMSGMAASNKKTPLLLLAAGTVNDFANYLHLPTDIPSICQVVKDFHVIPCDVGKVNDKYFMNVCAAGMFSGVSLTVGKEEKKLLGPLAYYIQGILDFPTQIQTNMQLRISFDKEDSFDCEALLLLITNTNRVGGFDAIVPQASIQDGLLDVLIVKKCNIGELATIYKDYLLKKHETSPYIIYKQVQSVDIECLNEYGQIDIDGEDGGKFPIHISLNQSQVHLLTPKQ
ncbi:diacylglycerol/lipid kinase family protein [Tannockella kyphosi]|uniref:diacylglycerol/lipid kinase family protein n=1 Tax=Tannockella kyphosi TaxID=2899121 RepID=UPI002011E878|nr:YegS/Rv2252/BmrU family lipid kinase [Tannockella kyphosi]